MPFMFTDKQNLETIRKCHFPRDIIMCRYFSFFSFFLYIFITDMIDSIISNVRFFFF